MDYSLRIKMLFDSFPESLQGVLVSNPSDIRYYTGFTGEGYVLIFSAMRDTLDQGAKSFNSGMKSGRAVIFTDARYTGLCRRQCPDMLQIEIAGGNLGLHCIYAYAKRQGLKAIGVDDSHLPVAVFYAMQSVFMDICLCAAAAMIHFPRKVKDSEEQRALAQAAAFADTAFAHLLAFIKPDMTEFQIASELSRYLMVGGSAQDSPSIEGSSFPVMVASGPNSAMPHTPVTGRRIQNGDFVVIDFGCVCRGYCSDMTRTVMMGKPSREQQRMYDTVLQAQRLALDRIKPGVCPAMINACVESFFVQEGYADCFLHTLGHGVGLCVHEEPLLADGVEERLMPGMVLAVEPGIYIRGRFGVRIEDMVIVTEEGCERITKSEQNLLCVGQEPSRGIRTE